MLEPTSLCSAWHPPHCAVLAPTTLCSAGTHHIVQCHPPAAHRGSCPPPAWARRWPGHSAPGGCSSPCRTARQGCSGTASGRGGIGNWNAARRADCSAADGMLAVLNLVWPSPARHVWPSAATHLLPKDAPGRVVRKGNLRGQVADDGAHCRAREARRGAGRQSSGVVMVQQHHSPLQM